MKKIWMAIISLCLVPVSRTSADETGASWRRVDTGDADRFENICWDGPLAVAVGSRGHLSTSTDGKSWTKRFSNIQADLKDVAWNGSHYVAVGSGGTILRSADGEDWQRIEAPAGNDYSGVAWTGTQFIALDTLYYLSTSADGITWSRFQAAVSGPCYGIEHFDGATYLLHTSGIARSTDLLEWTQVLGLSFNNLPKGIRKLNGRLFSVGPRQFTWSSPDGVAWTPSTLTGPSIVSQTLTDIAWNGSVYVAVGRDGWNLAWRSEDGIAWTAENPATANASYIRWINGEFVAGDGVRDVQTSPDGREWTKTGEHTQGNAAVWTGNRYITVGNYGYIATSPDFETWTTRDSGIHTHLQSVVWTGSFALAAGADGVVLRSGDGLEWTKVEGSFAGLVRLAWTGTHVYAFSADGTDISTDGISWNRISTTGHSSYDVKWLRDKFIAIGYSGSLESSPDGVTWTSGVSGTTGQLYAAAASTDEFMVGGRSGALLASSDGIEWTSRPVPLPGITTSSLDYRFGRWFLATTLGIYHSEDGTSWQAVPGIEKVSIAAETVKLVWTGSKLACTGLDAWTADGIHWEQREIRAMPPDFKSVAKGSGAYVAVGTKGAIWRSTDGYVWQAAASPTSSDLDVVASGGGNWVAAGSGGLIVSSADGIHWSQRDSGTTEDLNDIAWNGQRFVVAGDSGALLASVDGVSWTSPASELTAASFLNIEGNGSGFTAFGYDGRTMRSPDGITWNLSHPDFITDVKWNGSSYVAVGQAPDNSAWSHVSGPDALQWTRHPVGVFSFLTGLCWTGTQHVACGSGGKILTSPDGINWTPRDSGTTDWIQAVAWNGAQLVAVGRAGTLLYSPDGITWTAGTSNSINYDFEDVAWGDGRYVAVGTVIGGAMTSLDGIAWEPMSGRFTSSLTVDRIGDRFFAGGSQLYSATGTAWSSASTASFSGSIYDLEGNGNFLFAATGKGVIRLQETAPGRWNSVTTVHRSPWLDNMTHQGNEFVATGAQGTVVLSRDGTSWQTVLGGRDVPYAATAWSGSRFVGVDANRIDASPDGATWNPAPPPPGISSYSLADVVWTGSRFVAAGPSSTVFRSAEDGLNWTSIGSVATSPAGISSVAGDDELLVAVGSAGLIAVSDGSGEGAADYQLWISAQGAASGNRAPLQDANADGINNLLAYIHGIPATGSLTAVERAALPALSLDSATGDPLLAFDLRESYRPGAIYQVQMSSNLQPDGWQTLQSHAGGWSAETGQATVSESPLPGGGVRISVSNFPQAEGAGRFFRLRVLLP